MPWYVDIIGSVVRSKLAYAVAGLEQAVDANQRLRNGVGV